ncbi:probable pectinesterase 55 [Impatiens glandulifera]|uniref:probable pectinesterase 55 n=1 Tax=Impatiens glandulifera TaxID=253017 RepID=UPI001FB055E1|nr:probable pectinesterase 55 [Impatiens glandulifera]
MTSFFSLLISIVVSSTIFLCPSHSYEFSSTVTVDKSGKGQFKTIQEAINSVPTGNTKWVHIVVNPGVYNEKVTISSTREFIFLEGKGYSQTTISWDDHQATNVSATFSSLANNFVAKDISFMNSYNIKTKNTMKPALAIYIFGDKSAFYNCGFYGLQDTLYDDNGRHYFNSCYIEGAVDFIWGYGQSVYEGCKINSTAGQLSSPGFITAQGRESEQDKSGFVFIKGTIDGTGQVYLGRAYRAFSRVIFIEVTMSSVVLPLGWDAWKGAGKEGSLTNIEASCKGPGANSSKRATWTKIVKSDSADLQQFTTQKFIDQDGWLAKTRFL